MEDKRVEKVLYMKFNNNDKRGALMQASKKGIVIIDKPFKEVLKETIDTNVDAIIEKPIIEATDELEINLLWQDAIHANYLRYRRGYR